MNKLYKFGCVFLFLLLFGCNKVGIEPVPLAVEVELNGVIGPTTRSGWVNPLSGETFPEKQLSIGVVMLDFDSPTPASVQPTAFDWDGAIEWKRAYFGGPGLQTGSSLATFVPANGEIKFTNDAGTAINKVFYNENGFYRFLRAVHPWAGASVISSGSGGSILMPIDGSQDIMCANLGWGSITTPTVQPLHFEHLLTKLNIRFVAENSEAAGQYGTILAVEVVGQPDRLLFNIATCALEPYSWPVGSDRHGYNMVVPSGFPSLPRALPCLNTTTPDPVQDALPFGYAMALPADTYTIRVETELRLAFFIKVAFPRVTDPGTAYNITLQFMVADELFIYVDEADEWWLDSTFD